MKDKISHLDDILSGLDEDEFGGSGKLKNTHRGDFIRRLIPITSISIDPLVSCRIEDSSNESAINALVEVIASSPDFLDQHPIKVARKTDGGTTIHCIIDGHRRYKALLRANGSEESKPNAIRAKIVTKPLSPEDMAVDFLRENKFGLGQESFGQGLARLNSMGLSPKEIGLRIDYPWDAIHAHIFKRIPHA